MGVKGWWEGSGQYIAFTAFKLLTEWHTPQNITTTKEPAALKREEIIHSGLVFQRLKRTFQAL